MTEVKSVDEFKLKKEKLDNEFNGLEGIDFLSNFSKHMEVFIHFDDKDSLRLLHGKLLEKLNNIQVKSNNKPQTNKNENNDKKRDIYKELEIVVNFYETNITPQIAPNTLNEMKFLVEDYDPYLIIEAYKIAISKNIRHKESYIKSILSNWVQDGITEVSQLTKKGENKNAKPSRSKPGHHILDDLF